MYFLLIILFGLTSVRSKLVGDTLLTSVRSKLVGDMLVTEDSAIFSCTDIIDMCCNDNNYELYIISHEKINHDITVNETKPIGKNYITYTMFLENIKHPDTFKLICIRGTEQDITRYKFYNIQCPKKIIY